MQLKGFAIWVCLLLSYGCADAENFELLQQKIHSLETRNGIIEIVFEPYQYETTYCRYDILLIRDFDNKREDKHFLTYIKNKDAGDCSGGLDGYVEIASARPLIEQAFTEGKMARQKVLQMCSEDVNSFAVCEPMLATQTYDITAIVGPAYSIMKSQLLVCFKYWVNIPESKEHETQLQEICTNVDGPVSATVSNLFK